MEYMECLNEDSKKKRKRQILYTRGRDDKIVISAKLLDIMHECYGFSGDLIETID